MHIEPGIVEGAKMALGVVTAAGAIGYAAKLTLSTIKQNSVTILAMRSAITTLLVFCFFQVLPHYPVGVSEVHFILGATLFLIFGAGPAAIGLAMGLLAQGLLFAPADLPQYGMNVTSLLVPLLVVDALARRLIPAKTAYKDVKYAQALALSTAYQGGVVAWVAFWAFYGNGFGAENLVQVGTFSVAYMTVILIEPLLDLAILATAKNLHQLKDNRLFHSRLYRAAA
ncbi:energy-coupling factor ABC transporter permease [Candidatus Thiodiazotropha sp. CDECU1]|uniref:energy-coupling factor ABC transporter permease n=1 Tax=Candidatus Thiodiazotropha sp. CDECU1 TaxID=3065865 RepID=UPI00292F990A|nr:energy-coupling factor ABC transporter permease [Candidatus Thiodiazotropha sp. CDECU1]